MSSDEILGVAALLLAILALVVVVGVSLVMASES